MTVDTLRRENLAFVGTTGVSEENRASGFIPAFYDLETRTAAVSRFADGRVAPMHLIEGLPAAWVTERDPCGRVVAVKATVIAGFIRGSYFYTREQAAQAVH
jgi:hypothetical protein